MHIYIYIYISIPIRAAGADRSLCGGGNLGAGGEFEIILERVFDRILERIF